MVIKFVLSLILSMFISGVALAASPVQQSDVVLESAAAPQGGDFTLNSSQGPVSLTDYRGQVVVLYFGYTRCPDVCPVSLSIMVQALNELDDEKMGQVQPLFISVDPTRDSVDMLKDYAEYFHEKMIGLTDTETDVKRVADLYGAQYYEVELEGSAFGYAVNHSAATYLIDRKGVLRFIFPHETPAAVINEALEYLIGGE